MKRLHTEADTWVIGLMLRPDAPPMPAPDADDAEIARGSQAFARWAMAVDPAGARRYAADVLGLVDEP